MDRDLWILTAAFLAGLVPFFLWRAVVHARHALEPMPLDGTRECRLYEHVRELALWLTVAGWLVWPIVGGYVLIAAFGRWWVRREMTKAPAPKVADRETYR